MTDQLKTILEDLYKIDPSLKDKEQNLIKLINKLLEAQPDSALDENFVIRLRNQVMAQAKDLSNTKEVNQSSDNLNFMKLKPFAFAAAGAVITLIIAIPVINYFNQSGVSTSKISLDMSGQNKIARLSDNAFGQLGQFQVEAPQAAGRGSALAQPLKSEAFSDDSIEENVAVNNQMMMESADGEAVTEPAPDIAMPGAGGGGDMGKMIASDSMIYPAPDIINYEFKYIGDDITVSETSLPVYKRNKDNSLGQQIASVAQGVDFGLFDTSKLENISVGNLQLTEDREYGYITYFNFFDNSVSISMNWEKWPIEARQGRILSKEDVPADARLISIADKFLADYGIDKSNYGEPRVNRHWENPVVFYPEAMPSYVPEVVSIVYPYNIEGQSVQDQGGNLAGVTVGVNIRFNRVADVHGLVVPSYESSSYTTETDTSRLLKIAEQGGLNRFYAHPEAKETIILELGTPERGLIRHWQFNPGRGKGGEELFVPALIFPITNKDDAPQFWQRNVVVPLVKDILDTQPDYPVGIPEPMPLLRGEAVPGSAGSVDSIEVESSEELEPFKDDN